MLLFIITLTFSAEHVKRFQNIVCYCLSGIILVVYRSKNNFKTSYVTVYLRRLGINCTRLTFQNIVCYCLSKWFVDKLGIGLKFQNIVCYCLSWIPTRTYNMSWSFQNIVCYCLSSDFHQFSIYILAFQNIVCYCLSD